MELDKTFLDPFFRLRSAARPPLLPIAYPPTSDAVALAAGAFARRWLGAATEDEATRVRAQHPRIPQLLDKELVEAVEAAVGSSLRQRPDAKRAARQSFWQELLAEELAGR